MGHRLELERDLCIGAGNCLLAQSAIEMGDDGKAVVLRDGAVPEDELDDVEAAVSMCPVEALRLTEDGAA